MPPRQALVGLPLLERSQLPSGGVADDSSTGSKKGTSSSSISLTNLLQFVGEDLKLPSEGVYVGDGIPPVPEKLAAKIRRGEFIELGELLPEFWTVKGEDGDPSREQKLGEPVKLQCFGTYVSVRATKAPHLVPELMAYMTTIVCVSQDYACLAWVRYDAAFRRQAALTNNLRWSVINSTLYTMCFTGMASETKRCEVCFATSHTERECAQRGDPDPDMRDPLKAIESALLAMAGKNEPLPNARPLPPLPPSREPCRKWNAGSCMYPRCRHTHACSVCRGPHPASKCSTRGSQQTGGIGPHATGPTTDTSVLTRGDSDQRSKL